jgi:23S rRNA pseudouridine1911/1915/1917 synthase
VFHIPIIYEDKDLIVVCKPSGVVVNRSDQSKEDTLQEWAENKLKIKRQDLEKIIPLTGESGRKENFFERAGIVHRLDKETSGLLIIAKNSLSFAIMQKQFFDRKVEKKYIILVHGCILTKKGIIKAPVGRLPWDRQKFGVLCQGRPAETVYEQLFYFQRNKEKYSMIRVTPLTGRTHQIRIHFKYLGFPLVSDPLYTGRKQYKNDLSFCPRLFLHAEYLKFIHPIESKNMEFHIPLEHDLNEVLNTMTKIN